MEGTLWTRLTCVLVCVCLLWLVCRGYGRVDSQAASRRRRILIIAYPRNILLFASLSCNCQLPSSSSPATHPPSHPPTNTQPSGEVWNDLWTEA